MGVSKSNRNIDFNPNPLTKVFDWFVVIVLGAGLIFIFSGYLFKAKEPPKAPQIPDDRSIAIQILNGCGRPKEIMPIVQGIRELGINVADFSHEAGNIYPSSLVIDRRGNKLVADSIATIFGLSRKNIVIQRYDLNVDATVVIGLDYPHIKQKLGIKN